MPLLRVAYVGIIAAYLAVLAWAMTQLPDRVASHFDAAGRVDGWSSRPGYLAFGLGIGVFVLAGLPLLTRLLLRGSGAGINVPHKDYWLDPAHPERRAEFARRFTDDMLVFTGATVLLLTFMHVESVWANRQDPPQSGPGMWVALGVYLVVIFGWTAVVALKRYTPPTDR